MSTRGRSVSRTYKFAYGGWGIADDEPWYDCYEVTVHEGDICPECDEGKMLVSKAGKLYCSNICWKEEKQ